MPLIGQDSHLMSFSGGEDQIKGRGHSTSESRNWPGEDLQARFKASCNLYWPKCFPQKIIIQSFFFTSYVSFIHKQLICELC